MREDQDDFGPSPPVPSESSARLSVPDDRITALPTKLVPGGNTGQDTLDKRGPFRGLWLSKRALVGGACALLVLFVVGSVWAYRAQQQQQLEAERRLQWVLEDERRELERRLEDERFELERRLENERRELEWLIEDERQRANEERFRAELVRKLQQQNAVNPGLPVLVPFAANADENAVRPDISLYDSSGKAVAYITPDSTIYLWGGKPVAYLTNDPAGGSHVYGFNGKHLGWFVQNLVHDHTGKAAGGTKAAVAHAAGGFTQPESLKGVRQLKPLKNLEELAPLRPVFFPFWSATPLRFLLYTGATGM